MCEILKIAALVEIVPQEVKNMVFMTTERVDLQPKRNIFGWVSKTASAGGPVSMEIGAVAGDWCDEDGWSHSAWNQVDVAAVGGSGLSQTCGCWGHFSRECPSRPKGKGKGDISKGKRKGKEDTKGGMCVKGWQKWQATGKGAGAEGQGKGNGYQGTCCNCR